jgi:hypothetical protein
MRLHRKRGGNSRTFGLEEILTALNYLILPVGLFLRFQLSFLDDDSLLSSMPSNGKGLGIADNLQPVSCSNLLARNLVNSTSVNGQRLFLRYTKDEPRFWLSLHIKKYDPVRWATMDYGRYYEQKLVCMYVCMYVCILTITALYSSIFYMLTNSLFGASLNLSVKYCQPKPIRESLTSVGTLGGIRFSQRQMEPKSTSLNQMNPISSEHVSHFVSIIGQMTLVIISEISR